ncbi:hypothetical protein FXO38_17099 [Capsicum annuum]|nr:hypothetical protein FXO37_20030 [Capsicum annuum]KAF3650547.1 hypothetical protein FXO38_17099 [Capsicum annuum]
MGKSFIKVLKMWEMIEDGIKTGRIVEKVEGLKPNSRKAFKSTAEESRLFFKTVMTYHGKEVVEDVDEVGGLTRPGRCFVLESLRKSKPILEKMVGKIFKVNRISFSNDELLVEGTGHNRGLYITVKCKDFYVTHVMIDRDSGANICLISTLQKLNIDSERIRPNNVCVRAFDGAKLNSISEIELMLIIGPVEFTIEFQARSGIHSEGNLSAYEDSPLFLIEENNVEEIFVYQIFYIVPVNCILEWQVIPGLQLSSTSIMMVSELWKYGFEPGKGLGASLQGIVCPICLSENVGMFGLGFEPTAEDLEKAKGRKKETWSLPRPMPLLSESFVKSSVTKHVKFEVELVDNCQNLFIEVDMVEAGEGTSMADVQFIGPAVRLNNWEVTPLLPDLKITTNQNVMKQDGEYDEEEALEEISKELEQFEDKPNPNLNETEPINLGNQEDVRETKISVHALSQLKYGIIQALIDYKYVFAWSYDDMPGLSTELVAHKFLTDPAFPPIKQKLRKFKADIIMDDEDKEKMSFITPWGTYCYRVIPFDLKNTGVTYMRAMTTMFHDMMHKEIYVYVDDVIIKSKGRAGHVKDLRKFFERLRRYNIKLNPAKCVFGVPSGKLLGFMVSRQGIELDPSKIKAIQDFPSPKNRTKVMRFLGRLNYISRMSRSIRQNQKILVKSARAGTTGACEDTITARLDALVESMVNQNLDNPYIGTSSTVHIHKDDMDIEEFSADIGIAILKSLIEAVENLKPENANVRTSSIQVDYSSTLLEPAQGELDAILEGLAVPVDDLPLEVVPPSETIVNQYHISDSQLSPDFPDAVVAAHQAARNPDMRTRTKFKIFKSPYTTEYASDSKAIEDQIGETKQKFAFDDFLISDYMLRGVIEEYRQDCGVFVAGDAEYLSEEMNVPSVDFEAEYHQMHYASLLQKYGIQKAKKGYVSENDDPPRLRTKTISIPDESEIVSFE